MVLADHVGSAGGDCFTTDGLHMADPPDLEFVALQEALVGRYSLQRELGRGGMGIVYLASEVALDRPVALKLLPRVYAAQPVLKERFLREARTAAKLSHPNIVPIFAVDEVDDFVFFAMAFVEGETLGQRIRERGPLPPTEGARILREVAWALGYAHGKGVVHRDVKPDNILLEAEGGRALVTDFGIAHVAESEGLTGVTEILGTAEFMSPEQASGEPVDARSDLYSLGIVGHYILSGELPFQGGTAAATLAKHLTQEARALALVAPELPRNLSEAMDRCLAKDPGARFQSAEEMADALTRSLAVRREIPAPLRLFAEQFRESTVSIVAVSFFFVAVLIVFAVILIVEGTSGIGDIALGVMLMAALGATPVAMLAQFARRLLTSGHGYEEMVRSLRGDVEERRQELASQYGGRSRLNLWASRVAIGSVAAIVASAATIPLLPPGLWNVVGGVFMVGFPVLIGSGLVAAASHQIRDAVPGARWLKFWEGPLGRGVFRLAKFRLGTVAASGPAYGPTEMALGLAVDRLFEGLPRDVQESFSELPSVVRTLEADAERMRARVGELDRLLADVGSQRKLGTGRAAVAPGGVETRESLVVDLQRARDAAHKRREEVVAALEGIRLGLLRLLAGVGSTENMTASLTAAHELSGDIERVIEGAADVERLLGSD